MLDGVLKKQIDPALKAIGKRLAEKNVTANTVTMVGFLLGLIAAVFIIYHYYWLGLLFLLLSRLADGLDGSVAQATKATDFGGYLDIVLDFAFYGLIPAAFVIADPQQNAIAGVILILSFYFNGASFLAYSTLAEKHKLSSTARGPKSIYFTTGLAEATETIAVFCLFCVFPQWFFPVAYVFAAICFYTAFSRIILAKAEFKL